MYGTGHNQQAFVAALEALEGVFAEIARVGLFAMDQHHRTLYLVSIGKYRSIEEGEARGQIPALSRIDGTGVKPRGVL